MLIFLLQSADYRMAKECASFSPYRKRKQSCPAEPSDSDFMTPRKGGGRGKNSKGKGGLSNISGRQSTSKRIIPIAVIHSNNNTLKRIYRETVHYMPPGLNETHLASVGLSTRPPDKYELCPPGFTSLDDAPKTYDTSSKPRGRPRGRPRGSKKQTTTKSQSNADTNDCSAAIRNTTHRRIATKSQTAAASLQGKINKIHRMFPDLVRYNNPNDINTNRCKEMCLDNFLSTGCSKGQKAKPTCTLSRPISSDEDQLPPLDDVMGRRQHPIRDGSDFDSPVYPSTRSRAPKENHNDEQCKKNHHHSRKRPSYEEQSDVDSNDENM